MKKITAVLLALSILLAFAGCSNKNAADAPVKSSNDSVTPAAVMETPAPEKTTSLPQPAATPESAIECDWTLHVDDTVTKTTDGLAVKYNLVLIADKEGGIDEVGAYTGTVHLTIDFDASQMSKEMLKVMGGFNVDVYADSFTFDIVVYNIETYSEFGVNEGEAPLAPLVQYDSMALATPQMSGEGSIDIFVKGPNAQGGHKENAGSALPIPLKIAITGGKVNVSIPMLNLGDSFEGMVTGTPK